MIGPNHQHRGIEGVQAFERKPTSEDLLFYLTGPPAPEVPRVVAPDNAGLPIVSPSNRSASAT